MVLLGELAPGEQITQEALAERLGVSAIPLREALRYLEGDRMVTYVSRRGYTVVEHGRKDLDEIFLLQGILEEVAIRAAASRYVAEDIDRMRTAARDAEHWADADDVLNLTEAMREFRFALLEPCDMPYLLQVLQSLWRAIDPYRALFFQTGRYRRPRHRSDIRRQQRKLIAAAERKDLSQLLELAAEYRALGKNEVVSILPDDAG